MWWWRRASFLLALLLLTSCVIPIPIPISIKEDPAHYAARIEPPARYNHPYNGRVSSTFCRRLKYAQFACLWVLISSTQLSPQLARGRVTAPAILFYRMMNGCPLRISVGMKLPIAMVGGQIIRVMGEGFRPSRKPPLCCSWRGRLASPQFYLLGCQRPHCVA